MPESMTNREMIISEALETIKKYHELNRELEATATRLRGLLRRWNDNRVWNGQRCPFCLEGPIVQRYVDAYHVEYEDSHAAACEWAAELEGRDG